jgi:hypothetical protein
MGDKYCADFVGLFEFFYGYIPKDDCMINVNFYESDRAHNWPEILDTRSGEPCSQTQATAQIRDAILDCCICTKGELGTRTAEKRGIR